MAEMSKCFIGYIDCVYLSLLLHDCALILPSFRDLSAGSDFWILSFVSSSRSYLWLRFTFTYVFLNNVLTKSYLF